MKLIFLDFDGVILLGQKPIKRRISALNRIIFQSRAQIVVSSAWRHGRSVAELGALLSSWGVVGEVVGKTKDDSQLLTSEEIAAGVVYSGDTREEQIAAYLSKLDQVDYVILDDLALKSDRLVQTDKDSGLTSKHIWEALRVLGARFSIGQFVHTTAIAGCEPGQQRAKVVDFGANGDVIVEYGGYMDRAVVPRSSCSL